jgi:hypothetical protein
MIENVEMGRGGSRVLPWERAEITRKAMNDLKNILFYYNSIRFFSITLRQNSHCNDF